MREHRVVGPPGTGKTTYLKRQFERASERFGVENVYACSLTRTASGEIASRVERVPRQNIGTLHSHAFRLLGYPKILETTKGLGEWNDFCPPTYRISTKHAANPENASPEPVGADTDGEKLMQAVGIYRQRMVPVEAWRGEVAAFWRSWSEFKLEGNYVDFTDLIEGGLTSIDCIPGARVLFVDEAQDMSKLEFSLARKWGRKCDELVIVGDPDQNLYEWRGSDPGAFYAAEAASEHILEQSYRVPEAPHRAAVEWIKQIPDRIDAAYRPVARLGSVQRFASNWKDPTRVLDHIGKSDAERVMILASCGYMLNPVTFALRARGIPFENPYRRNHGAWNPLVGARRLLAFLRPSREVWGDDARAWTWDDVRRWSEVLQSKETFSRGFKSKVDVRCTDDRFGDSEADRPVDIEWLLSMCEGDDVREAVVNMDLDWWESALRHNDRKSQQFALTVARRHGASRLLQQPRVVVGTIHSVKGGEADQVFLYPDLSPTAYYDGWKREGKGRNAVVRQFYVGMTRTKCDLFLCDAAADTTVRWPTVT